MATPAQPTPHGDHPGGPAPGPHFQLLVTNDAHQGNRKYMEDEFCVARQPSASGDPDERHYSYLAVFDGHGGGEASAFARDNLLQHIINQEGFHSEEDSVVLGAIKNGFLSAHYAMWHQVGNWPKNHGLPSTAGTTASVVFLRRNKMYVGHVGDSGIVLGYQDDPNGGAWKAKKLTKDHVPDSPDEYARVVASGGKVGRNPNGGCPRIMFERPAPGFGLGGAPIISMPFLNMSRALGDFWSFNSQHRKFVVSPEPDTFVVELDESSFRCIILGTDGLWNMLTPEEAVARVADAHTTNTGQLPENLGLGLGGDGVNCSKILVAAALARWRNRGFPADNITAVTAINIQDMGTSPQTPPEPVAPVIGTVPAESTALCARSPSGSSSVAPPVTLAVAVTASPVSNAASSSAIPQGRQGQRALSVSTPPKGTATSGSAEMSGRGIGIRSEPPGKPGNRKRSLDQDLVTRPPTLPVAPVRSALAPEKDEPVAPCARPTSGSSTSPPLTLPMTGTGSQVSNGASSMARSQGRQGQTVSVSTPPPGATATSGSGMSGLGRTRRRSKLRGKPGNWKRSLNPVVPTALPEEGSAKRKSSRPIRPSFKLLESMDYFGTAPIPSIPTSNTGSRGRSEPKKARISSSTLLDSLSWKKMM